MMDTQKGGKYIGHGTTGCVFKSHLKCKDVNNIKNSIGKVFIDKAEYDEESRSVEIVKRIDPNNEFTVPLLGKCDEVQYFRRTDNVASCKMIKENSQDPKTYKQLIYRYGGKSLETVMEGNGTLNSFWKILTAFEPILKGIEKLTKESMVHLDIKPPNLLMLKDKLYLIDFGLLSSNVEVFKTNRQQILLDDYMWYPPEFKAYMSNNKGTIETLLKRYLDNFEMGDALIRRGIKSILNSANGKQQLEGFYNDKVSRKEYVQFAPKVDVYSLGIVFAQLFVWSGYMRKVYSRPCQNSVLRDHIRTMIKGMLNCDPRNRSSIQQVVVQYEKIMELRKCLKRKTSSVKLSPSAQQVKPKTKLNICLSKM